LTTQKIRILTTASKTNDGYSRLTEVEAYAATPAGATSTASVQWLVTDHLGTPRLIADASGSLSAMTRHDYMPFGEEAGAGVGGRTTAQGYSQADGMRQGFTGYEHDPETQLEFAQARFYASVQGRFISPDDFLNDTRVNDPASWNLYLYARNNPLTYVDPTGEEIYNKNLSNDEQKLLIDDLKDKTGYQSIYFDKSNELVIDAAAGFKGGSAAARTLLSDAVNTTDIRFNLTSVDTKSVAFAQVDAGTLKVDGTGKRVGQTEFDVRLDFKDYNQLQGDKEAIAAFSIGLGALHEIAHKLYTTSGILDTPNSDTNPGPVENRYINPIRQQLGLAARVYYSSKPVSAALKSFYPSGGDQLLFRLNGKDKMLLWQSDKVGGKIK
jgi:RHS repeat-associated protein